jgi:hypothetical protein
MGSIDAIKVIEIAGPDVRGIDPKPMTADVSCKEHS